ncbi:PREDICTED: inositol oxygenase isoform X1 [Rhinopithecus bieti]|uniref:inositol oxygenase isoform X1 n=1 Tax=Rhinopithecus bieti TaxID=61621 RepID=UPI00083C04C7|nr:PREDICTED: inositol oxygenase isoform X1 [Rhinopithecus bieti]
MKVTVGPDPSLVYRPDVDPEVAKDKASFRNYTSGPLLDRVFTTYKLMHTHQTVDFVRSKHAQFGGFSYKKMTVMEAVDLLDGLLDESDPDVDFPNSFHAFQTAEGIRKAHPDKDWFHLVGLLHDLGKVLALFGEPQWAVVGDTFPVGCRPQASVVFRDSTFQDNPDLQDPRYSTELGMYRPHCGLDRVLMSWGHDEYMYQVMKFNKFSLPPEVGGGRGSPAPATMSRTPETAAGYGLPTGFLYDPVPLLLPLAHGQRLPAAVQPAGPGHAALGTGVQQVRPLHQVPGPAGRGQAAALLPGAH